MYKSRDVHNEQYISVDNTPLKFPMPLVQTFRHIVNLHFEPLAGLFFATGMHGAEDARDGHSESSSVSTDAAIRIDSKVANASSKVQRRVQNPSQSKQSRHEDTQKRQSPTPRKDSRGWVPSKATMLNHTKHMQQSNGQQGRDHSASGSCRAKLWKKQGRTPNPPAPPAKHNPFDSPKTYSNDNDVPP